ncbi:MAG: hypothetical protein QGH25_07975, partial [Candidatus Latescibacteria bacterium]|nr:hypothetical protein [Candidatus Latescibacterota bacterium]
MTEILLQPAKTCELHIHMGGGVFTEDLLDLAREHYAYIDWSLYIEQFEQAYGQRPDPVALFRDALERGQLDA